MNLPGYHTFRRTVLTLTGIDLDCYKEVQLERRLQVLLKRTDVHSLLEYSRMITTMPERLKELQDFLTINVSEWFRNPERFDELQQVHMVNLLKGRSQLRIWSAGCANGSEAYSTAVILDEIAPTGKHWILASDLDEEVLKKAKAGLYIDKDIENVSMARRYRYLMHQADCFVVKPFLRAQVQIERINLLADPFPTELDIILCRNVVIYFTEEAKEALYRRFFASLRPGGILFVGGTESILRAKELGFAGISPFFYRVVK